jgi:sulfate/thiosulfate transport system ATP-binding protein
VEIENQMSVTVERLTKRFTPGGPPAILNVGFEAPTGAITAILGPSGAGKSTILRVIAGLELPDTGTVVIEGRDCSNIEAQERDVGLVFQSYALFQHMTVKDNVAFGLSVRGTPKRRMQERVRELLRLVQLEDLADRYPFQLSGGQKQRVAFARALAIQPKVLLLDEPFGSLDTPVRLELREWLLRLHNETHITTLLVTHDQQEAMDISEHIVVVFDGKVAQTGTPQQILQAPATSEIETFLESSSVRQINTGQIGKVEQIEHVLNKVRISVSSLYGRRFVWELPQSDFAAMPVVIGDRVLLK